MKTATVFSVLVIMILQLQGSESNSRIWSRESLEPVELALTKTDVIQQPQNATVDPDENVDLACVFSDPNPAYCGWTRNGFAFAPSGGHIEFTGENSNGDCSIRINSIVLIDSGEYQCTFPATEIGNGAQSKIATVTVLDKPDGIEIVDYENGAELILFETGNKITCTAKDGNPAASLTWLLSNPSGSEELNGISTVEPGTTPPLKTAVNELVLDAVDELDHGELSCSATHETLVEGPLSTSVVLRIAKPVTTVTASFEEIPDKTDISIPTGSTITLTCTADGYPLASYSWTKKDTDGNWAPFSSDQTTSMTAEDGQFTCIAVNSKYPIGERSEVLKITLTGPLAIVEHPQDSTAHLGEDLHLNCMFGAEVVSCNWFKDNTSLSLNDYIFNGDKTTGNCAIILPNMQVNQDGKYYCEAATVKSNEATVTVQQAPKSPVLMFEGSEVPENSIIHAPTGPHQISCTAESGKPVADIVWTQNEVIVTGTPVIAPDVDNPKLLTITSTVDVTLTEAEPSVHVVCRSSHPAYPLPGYKKATVTFQYTEPAKHN